MTQAVPAPGRPGPSGPAWTESPAVAWPARLTAEQACARVARRLPDATGLAASRYHHPFLGLVFACGTGAAAPMLAPVVVDLVGGRAYLSDGWDEESLEPVPEAEPAGVRGPRPVVAEDEAVRAGRALLAGVLLRRRRLDVVDRAELHEPPLLLGKPNWWVTGRRGDRRVEVIVDGLSGRHYACSA